MKCASLESWCTDSDIFSTHLTISISIEAIVVGGNIAKRS